jgi:diacylglycerol kinase (ATP)
VTSGEAAERMFKRALIILNPGSRSADEGALEAAFDRHASGIVRRVRRLGWGESAEEAARAELGEGWDVVVAAGGDGTVSGVARAAREVDVPLAIAPMGTGNLLAEQLGIPGDLNKAIRLLSGPAAVRRIDAMEINGCLYFLNAGVGVSAKTVRDTSDSEKHLLGLTAYVWRGLASSFTFPPTPCSVSIDGREHQLRILDVSIINAGFRSEHPAPGIPNIRPDDGRLNVLIVWAPRPLEYFRHLRLALFFWRRVNPNIQWHEAARVIEIDCDEPLSVQADGDLVAETPVTIRVVPGAVGVVVPADRAVTTS